MNVLNIKDLCISSADLGNKPLNNGSDFSSELLLENVNCALKSGEILTIIGPNGAGKSSLLKAIAGDLSYRGELQMTSLAKQPTQRARQMAVLPQFSLLNFPYRVFEVVQLGRIPHQTGDKVDRDIIAQALELMDISYLANRLYPELSGGEKQRVHLARVLAQIWRQDDAQGPRLLLLDEPVTALDLGHQHDLMQAISEFAKQDVAVLMVLHDINLAARYSDKLLALLCSQQIAFGKVDEVITQATVERLFNTKIDILRHPKTNSPIIVGV